MNITQLQYLVDVSELGSFTEAAKKNAMTVPAISISISQLETELDISIFTRSRKGVIPTNEGKQVIGHAISILKSFEKMKYDISVSKNKSQGTIVIATIPGIVSSIINTTLEFRRSYPLFNVKLVEGDTLAVLDKVKNGEADMGFVTFGTNNQEDTLKWEPVIRDEAVLVCSKGSSLRYKNHIVTEDLKDEVIVLYNDPFVKNIADELLTEEYSNRVALTTNNVDAILQLVMQANAITIATDYIVHSLPPHLQSEVIKIALNRCNDTPNYLWRVTKQDKSVPHMIEQFTSNLLSYLK